MGAGSFDANSYRSFSNVASTKTVDEIYTSKGMHKDLDPKGVAIRESRDSADNPQSTPIIVGLDVTGSMGMLAEVIAKQGLGTLFQGILDRNPVTNPHLMFMGIGDANCDRAPLQVSQFEADNRIVEQLTKLWIEHGGGGNNFESYNLPWYFAARHTEHDSMQKRGKRGYLFTVGDEEAPKPLTAEQLKRFMGDSLQADVSTEEILAEARRSYDVFHIVVEEGDYARRNAAGVFASWAPLLGQRVIRLSDHKLLAQTIVSAIEVAEGVDAGVSARGWGASGHVIHAAVQNLPKGAPAPKMLGR